MQSNETHMKNFLKQRQNKVKMILNRHHHSINIKYQ